MYTIVSAVLRQQKESDVMTSFGLSARSAVYYEAGSQGTISKFLHAQKNNIFYLNLPAIHSDLSLPTSSQGDS
jgi:hypothetical protein